MSAALALQQAVYGALTASANIKNIVDDPPRVFDTVPRASAFPYIVIGDDRQTDWSTATEAGSEHIFTIDVWSRSAGRKEARLASEAVIHVLDNAALTVPGFALVSLRFLTSQTLRESDGETIHARLEFRAVLEPS